MMSALNRYRVRIVLWIYHRVPSCEEQIQLASERMERSLRPGEWLRFQVHLLICLWCRRYLKQIGLLHDAAPHLHDHLNGQMQPAAPRLTDEARERIKRRLATERTTGDT